MSKTMSVMVRLRLYVCVEDPTALPYDFERRKRNPVTLPYKNFRILKEVDKNYEIMPTDKPWFVVTRACVCTLLEKDNTTRSIIHEMHIATRGKEMWGSNPPRTSHWANGAIRLLFDIYKPPRYRRNLHKEIVGRKNIEADLESAIQMYLDGKGQHFKIQRGYEYEGITNIDS